MNAQRPSVEEGYARARALTRRHAKSFYFASVGLFGDRRRAAFALYAFCRRLDDLVDGDNTGDGVAIAPLSGPDQLAWRLSLARSTVSALYGRESTSVVKDLPWHPAEFAAFRDTVTRYGIPELPFQELINGMEMDLTKSRYANFDELALYCHRVAGVVGLMMTPVLGYRDARCLPYAADLGVAMQLTNILRDVKEDLSRGRVYLPADELARFGISEAELARGQVTEAWRAFAKFQVDRARSFYASAQRGIPDLQGFGSQRVVRLMSVIYGNICDVIEARGYDVFSQRARVTFGGKLRLAAGVLLTPNPRPVPLLSAGHRTEVKGLQAPFAPSGVEGALHQRGPEVTSPFELRDGLAHEPFDSAQGERSSPGCLR